MTRPSPIRLLSPCTLSGKKNRSSNMPLSCTDRQRTPRPSHRHAFVLVMVLVLLAVAAFSLAGIARRSLQAAEEAATAQADLQRHWGVLSALRLYLPSAETLLEGGAKKMSLQGQGWPLPPSISSEFALHGLQFTVLLADEDAKVNLNALFRQGPDGASQVTAVVGQLGGTDGAALLLQPIADAGAQRNAMVFRSWGQVFDLSQDTSPGESADRLKDQTREITCWGSGRLNVRRASDQAVRLVCQDKLGPDVVGKLLSLRREPGIKDLDALLSRLALRVEDRSLLERRLSDRSTRHSIWVLVRDKKRVWATLAIDRGGGSSGGLNSAVQETFSW
jgi:hypothetical protein